MLQIVKQTWLKRSAIICAALALLYCVGFMFFLSKFLSGKAKIVNLKHDCESRTKFVLYWSPFWKTWDYQMGYAFEPFKNCEFSNCFATENRTFLPLKNYAALIFHASYNKKRHGIPWVRSFRQRYIFMNWEAPVTVSPNLKQYSSYFNWTMTYRFDSDIVRRHGYVFKEKTNYTMPSEKTLKKKTKLAAWMVSNCKTSNYREVLAKEIQRFMPVDIYGKCGTLKCPRMNSDKKISSPQCYDMIEKKYKFYFAFENSYCRDYSTEKLYNILIRDLVPVVYGFGDYKLSAPPKSVINVADFENVEDLVHYLRYLDKNVKEYLKYFKWKKNYRVSTSLQSSACAICKMLHEPVQRSAYHNLHEWWWGKNKSMCKTGKFLPKIVSDVLGKKKL